MGFFDKFIPNEVKKVFKPVAKFSKKFIPKELRPFLPLATPFLPAMGIMGQLGGPMGFAKMYGANLLGQQLADPDAEFDDLNQFMNQNNQSVFISEQQTNLVLSFNLDSPNHYIASSGAQVNFSGSINDEIFSYCRANNIKICSWFIDSVSPEFFKDKTKNNFLKNLENVDYCFLTSSPHIFKQHKNFKKLKFIPNPVDSAIDNYKNYKNSFNEYDIFVAISHGQNRGILKKGKFDEREKFINEIISDLPQFKFAQFGINNFEPVWGSNYYHYLSKTKMALNISRGKYQNKYSSDRISSLIGNGLLVFINQNTNFDKILTKKEVVYYKSKKDLIKKLKFYNMNDKLRIKIAKSGYEKYHKYMSNIVVSNYILSCAELNNIKKPFWHSIV